MITYRLEQLGLPGSEVPDFRNGVYPLKHYLPGFHIPETLLGERAVAGIVPWLVHRRKRETIFSEWPAFPPTLAHFT